MKKTVEVEHISYFLLDFVLMKILLIANRNVK